MDERRYLQPDSRDHIILGDESAQNQISFQVIQDFYNEITKKSEKITDRIKKPFIVKIENIENLDKRVEQSLEQYHTVSSNATFTLKYMDESSERYSSVDRLKLHSAHRGVAVKSLDIEYILLIVLPKTRRPQQYKISISLISRTAMIEAARKDVTDSVSSFIEGFYVRQVENGRVSIDFVDITVAQALMTTLKTWFQCLDYTKSNAFFTFIRKRSHYLRLLVRNSFLGLAVWHVYVVSFDLLTGINSLDVSIRFALGAVLYAYLAIQMGDFLGRIIERNIDMIYEISYICLSQADTNLVENSKAYNTKNIIKGISALAAAFLVGVASSVAAAILFSA